MLVLLRGGTHTQAGAQAGGLSGLRPLGDQVVPTTYSSTRELRRGKTRKGLGEEVTPNLKPLLTQFPHSYHDKCFLNLEDDFKFSKLEILVNIPLSALQVSISSSVEWE